MDIQEQLQPHIPSRRSRTAGKASNMKRKAITFSIGIALLACSTQAYAAVALDSNLISLIKNGVKSLGKAYEQKSDADSAALQSTYKNVVDQSVTDAKNSADSQLAKHTANEMSRADQELRAYSNELKQQINAAVNQQVESSKKDISVNVDKNIDAIKKTMDQELQNQLKEVWKN